MKESVDKRRLGDPQQDVFELCGLLAFRQHAIVFIQQIGTLDLFPKDEVGIAGSVTRTRRSI